MEAKFGFLTFNKMEELDLIGPWEMINLWGKEYNGPKEIFTISQNGGLIECDNGLQIVSACSFKDCPQLDYLLIPGGMGTRKEVDNKILIDFIRLQAKSCHYVGSICTGTFLLQAAGLLTNCKVTTHWESLERLRKFTELTVYEERFIKSGSIWTAAGISAGMDMALAMIADIAGDETAGKVQLSAEYFPNKKNYLNVSNYKNLPTYILDEKRAAD